VSSFNDFYRTDKLIITFKVITDCLANKKIIDKKNQYLALLALFDGYIHIISKQFRCEKIVRITQNLLITVFFEPNK
jgi:hypothetical protein